jgi:Flp pilus assembly protein TadD
MRDGSNAVVFAEKAVAATSRTNTQFLDTLAAAYAEVRQFDKAVAAEQEVISLLPKGNTNNSFALKVSLYQSSMPYRDHDALAARVKALLEAGKFSEAEPLAHECVALREKLIPDEWFTFNARSMLGGCLLGQKKFAAAEPVLLSGYEGLKQREDKISAAGKLRPKEAAERIVQFYEVTGQRAKAAEWKKKLQGLNATSR